MVTDYGFFLHFQTTRVEQRTFSVLKNDLSQKMDHTDHKKSSYYYIYGMYQWTMLKFLDDCFWLFQQVQHKHELPSNPLNIVLFFLQISILYHFWLFRFLYNISNANGNYINIWKNNTYYIFKFHCKSRATFFLCSWFIANICGTGLLGILGKGLIVFIFFRVKRKKNLWLSKPNFLTEIKIGNERPLIFLISVDTRNHNW